MSSDRKLVLSEGTIVDCDCKLMCSSRHFHTLEYGKQSEPRRGWVSKLEKISIKKPTHTLRVKCNCTPTIDGVPQQTSTHMHVHTLGPKGRRVQYSLYKDLEVLNRRHVIVIEDCKSCLNEKEPHDHAVLEGLHCKERPILD